MNKPFAVVIGLTVVARFDDWHSAATYADAANCDVTARVGVGVVARVPAREIADVINLEFDADDVSAWSAGA